MFESEISEKEWNKLAVHFEGENSQETISVLRKCPQCCKIITKGIIYTNIDNEVKKMEGWKCKNHGEVEPYFEYF